MDRAPDACKTTIICSDLPVDLLLKKPATEYFSSFGTILKLTLRPKSQTCIITYEDPDEAAALVDSGGDYEGQQFIVEYHVPLMAKKRPKNASEQVNIKKGRDVDIDWVMDPEVRAELAAMGELTGKRTYNTRPVKMIVEEEADKRDIGKRERKGKVKETGKGAKANSGKSDLYSSKEQKDFLKIMSLPCYTEEDKLRCLEARDKFIRIKIKKNFDLTRSAATVGTCPDMCPEKERVMREVQHQVALYEQETDSKSMNQQLAVKQYSRSSADQEAPLPHELRNVDVLQMTMAYLMHRIIPLCDNPEINLGDWYHFLWDRTRSIRKDITQQELCSPGSVELVEQCARFHVHCSARLVAEDPSVFDQKINTENLTKCLQTLKYMYHDLSLRDGQTCPNEAEFRAYIILLNLNDGNFMWEVQQLSSHIQKSREIQFALQVYSALDKNNYVNFFKLLHSTTYLNSCILLRYFNQVRIRALRTILKCYSPRSPHSYFPISDLQRVLAFEGIASTRDFLEYHNLMLSEDRQFVLLDRYMFQMPDIPYALDRATNVIESKRGQSLGLVTCGKELPPPFFETHVPQDSFKGEYLDYSDMKELLDIDVTDDVGHVKSPISTFLNVHSNLNSRSNSPIDFIGSCSNDGSSSIFGGSIFNVNQHKEEQLRQQDLIKKQQEEYRNKQLELEREQLWHQHQQVEMKMKMELENQEKERQLALQLERQMEEERLEADRLEELRVLELERERVLELLKIEERDRELEEQKRLQELERHKQAKLQEQKKVQEQLRLKLLVQQEQRRKDLQMQQDVRELLTDLVEKVQKELNQDRLKEIKTRLVDYKMALFLQKWRLKTLRNKRKRKSMDLQPQYVQHRNIEDEAKEIEFSGQKLTLSLIKRYKYGHALNLTIEDDFFVPFLDVPNLVGDILINKQCNTFLESEIFWKVAFSLPNKNEMKVGLDRVTTVFDSLMEFTTEGYTWTACNHKNVHLNYCFEKEPKMCVSDNNGLIIIGDVVDSIFYNRVLNIVKELRIHSKVSAVIILQKESKNDDQLRNLLNKSCLHNTKIVYRDFTRRNVFNEIKEAVICLANNVQKSPPLELDLLSNFVKNNLVYELWQRVRNLANWNVNYHKCLTNPNVVIQLHNEAVNRIKKIIFTITSSSYRDFPQIFKNFFIHDKPCYPCDYKYFPNCWRDTKYKRLIAEKLEKFKLPEFKLKWPPADEIDLEKTVTKYLCYIFDFAHTEKTFLKVMAVFLKYTENSFSNIQDVVWTEVIQVIILEKLQYYIDLDFEQGDLKFIKQYFAVYEISMLKDFSRNTWFYLNNNIIKTALKTLPSSEELFANVEDFELELNDDDENIDETLNKITMKSKAELDTLNINNKVIKNKEKLYKLGVIMKDLEQTMILQKRINNLNEFNLRDALK